MKLNLKNKKDIDDRVLRAIIQYGLGFASRVKNLEEKCIDGWESDKLYDKSSFVIYDGYIWEAKVTNQSSTWNEKYWTKLTDELSLIELDDIKALINLSDEEIVSLQSLISTEIRLDRCFSSSDTYNRLLTVENNCKTFTMEQLAKKTGASYKIVTSTAEMTSTEFLYLLANVNNGYDIYVLIDGTAQKIGDTSIDLSAYYTKEEIDNDFLKKAEAESKYATITTVDDKVEKTSILSTISDTPSDDKLLSEKAINDTLVKKTDLTTTIDENSTDSQVPSAKSVYDKVKSMVINQIATSFCSDTIEKYLDTLTPNVDVLFVSNDTTGELVTLTGEHSFLIEYRKVERLLIQRAYQARDGRLIACRSKIEWHTNWSTWQKVCTTSVADVPKTLITSEDTNVTVNQNSVYTVINGICYVQMWGFKVNTVGQHVINNSLPKPKITSQGACFYGNEGRVGGCIFVFAEGNKGKVYTEANVTGESLYGSFSYPVAES